MLRLHELADRQRGWLHEDRVHVLGRTGGLLPHGLGAQDEMSVVLEGWWPTPKAVRERVPQGSPHRHVSEQGGIQRRSRKARIETSQPEVVGGRPPLPHLEEELVTTGTGEHCRRSDDTCDVRVRVRRDAPDIVERRRRTRHIEQAFEPKGRIALVLDELPVGQSRGEPRELPLVAVGANRVIV